MSGGLLAAVTAWDWKLLDALLALRCPLLDWLMPLVTGLGNSGWCWIVLGLLLCLRRRDREEGLAVLLALVFCLVVGNLWLKPLVMRPRPFWERTLELLIEGPMDFSFPSGHTMAAFAAVAALWRMDRRRALGCLPLAAGIAFSRLYLAVHYPSDVLAGAALGVLLGLAAAWLIRWSGLREPS